MRLGLNKLNNALSGFYTFGSLRHQRHANAPGARVVTLRIAG